MITQTVTITKTVTHSKVKHNLKRLPLPKKIKAIKALRDYERSVNQRKSNVQYPISKHKLPDNPISDEDFYSMLK